MYEGRICCKEMNHDKDSADGNGGVARAIAHACEVAFESGEEERIRAASDFLLGDFVNCGRSEVGQVMAELAKSEVKLVRHLALDGIRGAYWSDGTGVERLIGTLILDSDVDISARARSVWADIRSEMRSMDPLVLIGRGIARESARRRVGLVGE